MGFTAVIDCTGMSNKLATECKDGIMYNYIMKCVYFFVLQFQEGSAVDTDEHLCAFTDPRWSTVSQEPCQILDDLHLTEKALI